MSAVTRSVTSVAPTYMMIPSRWSDAAEGPAGSRADCGPPHPARDSATKTRINRRSRPIRRLQGVEIGCDVPCLLDGEPDVRHPGLGRQRWRLPEEGDEHARLVGQVSGNQATPGHAVERRPDIPLRKADARKGMVGGAAIGPAGDECQPPAGIAI